MILLRKRRRGHVFLRHLSFSLSALARAYLSFARKQRFARPNKGFERVLRAMVVRQPH
jgi:hypothetical protein